jgi:thiol:disulfide interchange protein DsbD
MLPDISFLDSSIKKRNPVLIQSPTVFFSDPLFDGKNINVGRDSVRLSQQVEFSGIVPSALKGKLTYTTASTDEFSSGLTYDFQIILEGGKMNQFPIKRAMIDIASPLSECGDEGTKGKSSLIIFLLGFLGGLVALITPCVFPLIPLTVSFFTKKTASKKQAIFSAGQYGLFIILIYLSLSIPFHLIDSVNPEVLNNLSTNTWLNLLFFLVFVFFAISFFGYFEITLPSSFASEADAKSGLRSSAGIFFMALTLAIVSFSCTGPILGSLLAGALSKEGGAWQLTAGMGGFGLGLALPFALFALFPRWLQSLPKSGGWLNTVKVVLGFLELAMALKFLSNADLVEQWGVLKREIFIGIWALISLMTGLYLLGYIRFPHDSKVVGLKLSRWIFIIVFWGAFFYLVPGISNTKYAKLSLLSGFPPPACYSIYDHPVNCKNEVEPLKDYTTALDLAKKQNKPLLIDFTGWACVNCRKMEEQVWTDPAIRKLLLEEFIVVSLYVDERKVLPADQQQTFTTSSGVKKEINTVGDQWATFQSENFHAVAQPQYAILGSDEQLITRTKGYTPDVTEFGDWLRCGIETYRNKYNR